MSNNTFTGGWIAPNGQFTPCAAADAEKTAASLLDFAAPNDRSAIVELLEQGWSLVLAQDKIEFSKWPTDEQVNTINELGIVMDPEKSNCILGFHCYKSKTDPLLTDEAFKNEPWHEALYVFTRVGICSVSKLQAFALRDALARLGHKTRVRSGTSKNSDRVYFIQY